LAVNLYKIDNGMVRSVGSLLRYVGMYGRAIVFCPHRKGGQVEAEAKRIGGKDKNHDASRHILTNGWKGISDEP
jgi:hypothetical protein